jgi:thioredoxin reductase
MTVNRYDCVIIGAGPIGLDAGIHALKHNLDLLLLEKEDVGNHLRQWHGVRMFTPFEMNRSETALEFASNHGVDSPKPKSYLTGKEYVSSWLEPLVERTPLSEVVKCNTRVESIARRKLLKSDRIGCDGRTDEPFRLVTGDPEEPIIQADTVIDASGTFEQPNPLGTGGTPAPGETQFEDQIEHRFPTNEELSTWDEERILLVGGGFSAATNLTRMRDLNVFSSSPDVHWLVRSSGDTPLSTMKNDPLPRRDELRQTANTLAQSEDVTLHRECGVDRLTEDDDGITVHFTDKESVTVDRIVSNVGYRPDRSLYRELQFHECYGTEGPIDLAASLLAQEGSDCLDVDPGGVDRLETPEPNFFVLGSKSYGRQSNFLLETGFRQVNELFNSPDLFHNEF